MLRYAIACVAIFSLCSCTDEQIARVKETVDRADLQLVRADEAVAKAEAALATAKSLAVSLNGEQANRVIGQAEAALVQVHSARDIVALTDKAAHAGLDMATESQAAGGSTLAVLGASAKGAIPGLLAALYAGMKWFQTWRSFRQTVAGIDSARKGMDASTWDTKVAPSLSAAQDEKTKKQVAVAQAKNA